MWFFRGALLATRSHLSAWRSMPMASNGNAFIKSEHVITSQCSMMITLQTFSYICLIIHHNQKVDNGRQSKNLWKLLKTNVFVFFYCFCMALGWKCTSMLFHGAYPPKESEPSHVSQSKESDGTNGLKNQVPVSRTLVGQGCILPPHKFPGSPRHYPIRT